MNINNKGRFSIDLHEVREKPEEVAKIMSLLNVVIVRAEALFISDKIQYEGLSPYFEEVGTGYVMPEYDIIVHYVDGLINKVEAKRT